MQAIRLLHIYHYDNKRRRFRSTAFQNSSSNPPGISIISAECISRSGSAICEHIALFYSPVAGHPTIFWIFSTEILPDGHTLTQAPALTGDECHYNIHGLTDKQARDVFLRAQFTVEDFRICEDGVAQPVEFGGEGVVPRGPSVGEDFSTELPLR